jgi:hypothetical protein
VRGEGGTQNVHLVFSLSPYLPLSLSAKKPLLNSIVYQGGGIKNRQTPDVTGVPLACNSARLGPWIGSSTIIV